MSSSSDQVLRYRFLDRDSSDGGIMKENNSILTFLTDRGVVISRQRAWIIGAICRCPVIPDVEQFWMNLRRSKPVSWATTHSTFRVLTEMGIVEKFRQNRRNSSYKLSKMFYDQRDKT